MIDHSKIVVQSELPGLTCRRGKVRDTYDLGEQMLIVACDRISAFDVILPTPIPEKGCVLTRLSKFWFDRLSETVDHHLIEIIEDRLPPAVADAIDGANATHLELLRGRAMVCRKAEVVPIECVVRGYVAGSGWRDYQRSGRICGIDLPGGLQQCERLPQPVFTPSTKAEVGHDENISYSEACDLVGETVMRELRERSLAVYQHAAEYAAAHGIIIADTKFEWGHVGRDLILVDEVLTPDSSRFWPADDYAAGRDQDSFDKQYVRNHLQQLCDAGEWDKTPPAPPLPQSVVRNTTRKYVDAFERLTGRAYPAGPDLQEATGARPSRTND